MAGGKQVVGELGGCHLPASAQGTLSPPQDGGLLGVLEDKLLGSVVDDGGAAERRWVSNAKVMEGLFHRAR